MVVPAILNPKTLNQKPTSPTIQFTIRRAIETLAAAGIDSARLDAEVLLAHVLHTDRSWLFAHPDERLSAEKHTRFEQLIARRAEFEPVAYLIGEREFFGLPFFVSPDVLIPRPETELLVEIALARLPKNAARVIDVGTGSGCIAVTLAVQRPLLQVIATDISAAALAVARKNARRHGVSARVQPVQADLLAGFSGTVDAIVSNPPYVNPRFASELPATVRQFEPHHALFSSNAGLAHMQQLVASAGKLLANGGFLLIEIGAEQGESALAAAQSLSPHATFSIVQDLAGRARLLVGEYHHSL